MKVFGLIITLLIMFSAVADELPIEWTMPSLSKYDVRCGNFDKSHPKYGYGFYGVFFKCENIPWTEQYNSECMAFIVLDDQNTTVKSGSLTRGVYYVTEEIREEHLAELDPEEIHYFGVNSMTTGEFNTLDTDKVRSEEYPWGYESFIAYQKDDTYVGTFPAVCQFKNHFPEEG